jgi:hypothetical protein
MSALGQKQTLDCLPLYVETAWRAQAKWSGRLHLAFLGQIAVFIGHERARGSFPSCPSGGPVVFGVQSQTKGIEMVSHGSGLYLATMLAASSLAAAETPLTIDQLLAQGWEIAGYASGYDNRTSLILFRHPGVNALVQCGILYDVTRVPRTVVNCYELR